ncbi:MAG TPA: ABC transporter ATP-binding protein [Rhizomicrobium sp.]|nr:ABC transporter ATP-binding protein [Rhizomicrobium sp.]
MPLLVAGAKDRVRPPSSLRARRLRKFLSYYRPYLGWLVADLACAFVVSSATLALPLCVNAATKHLLGAAAAPDALGRIWMLGALMLALVVAQALCNAFVDYQGHMMGARMEGDMRVELFEHYQKLSFGFYDGQRTGQLMARLTHDPLSLAELYHHGPEDLAIAAIKFAGVLVILLRIDVPLTLLILAFLPVMAAYAFHFNRRMNQALRQSKDRIGDINAQVEDSLAGIRVVKAFANEAIERAQFARANRRFLDSRRDGYRSEAWFYSGMTAFTQLITITVIVIGAAGILRATLDFADLLTFLLCVSIMVDPIQRLVGFARLYQDGMTGFDRFMEMLEVEPDIRDAPNARDLADVRGRIEFRSVSFRYRDDTPHVVRDLSLDIAPGDFVALVGASGVGKTTLCSLIPRFYETTEGDILIDGHGIRDIRLHALRRNIGIVQQEVYLFAGSVADNLRYGKPDATQDEIAAAARKAQAHDFIMALPRGYDTDIGQRGVKLSGGQKQRLAIARVFLKDPPILIFDEATSALDNESESAVQQALQALAKGRTTLVIAHRLSTIRRAQRIVVLTDKGIAEEGTHEALLASGGVYANLYNIQAAI